ncbi:hypothetical protein CP533_6739 [Ophiocordyceps camponoti-saundersi (nom. inval.)]|nr:hypothetical protein CP533_6739 [Ophiocordyceps camponoti-saundersi (nom. inval.)]
MASCSYIPPSSSPNHSSSSSSSYGYDFTPEDELQLCQLVAEASGHHHVHSFEERQQAPSRPCLPDEVDYPDLSRALSELRKDPNDETSATTTSTSASVLLPSTTPTLSPLQRFRSFPRRPLSVSDLTSGAWCELQQWYTLSRLPGGRRSRTPAMKQGSEIHQKLEDEVHVRVKIEVLTKEDAFALKLWNYIQGLRSLRETGLTRELEVWGLVDGNLVNGVIDGVSHEHPNPDFEEELCSEASSLDKSKPENNSLLTDYFPPRNEIPSRGPKVYLTDVKTRGSTAPVSAAQLRPAKYQLLLYHRFLSAMAADQLPLEAVVGRYGLNPDLLLSDTFLAQMGGLHEEVFYDAPSSPVEGEESSSSSSSESSSTSTSPSADEPIRYRTLSEIWSLLRQETRKTFPQGRDSLGRMLRVEYVHRSDGRFLDAHDFPFARHVLDGYLDGYMAWWRGERRARGVEIEEAFKCRSCEFASGCEWRLARDEMRLEAAQKKLRPRGGRKKKAKVVSKVDDGRADD